MAELVTLVGDPGEPHVYNDETAMMLFLSDKGKAHRGAFERGQVYVGEWAW